jgi:hypothetical protein
METPELITGVFVELFILLRERKDISLFSAFVQAACIQTAVWI